MRNFSTVPEGSTSTFWLGVFVLVVLAYYVGRVAEAAAWRHWFADPLAPYPGSLVDELCAEAQAAVDSRRT